MVRFFKKDTAYTPYYDKDGYLVSEYFDEFVGNEMLQPLFAVLV